MKSVKRALWLMNHTTLRQFEVPLLQQLGYEVYVPKKYPYDEGNMSASVDWSYDQFLTIPKEDLDALNDANFYEDISSNISAILNKYFDIALFAFFPKQLQQLVLKFEGKIIMRPFGLNNGASYTEITIKTLGIHFMEKLESVRERFWFGQGYENLGEIETGVYKQKAITLPIGLKDAYEKNTWIGDLRQVFFICPRINTSPYFNEIYKQFKNTFGIYPHVIGGAQPIVVNDKNVTGFVTRERFEELMNRSKLMFYHSQEQRHLHYHPLEAVKYGLPLVFMAGGMLDALGGEGLPGRCRSKNEAKKKIKRILNNDQKLIKSIKSTQGRLLEKVNYDYCSKQWSENFKKIETSNSLQNKQVVRKKKIAVILPIEYRGGTLDTVKMYAKMLQLGAEKNQIELEVVLGHIDSHIYNDHDFDDLREMGISNRKFNWSKITKKQMVTLQKFLGYDASMTEEEYLVPNDGINNFLDCDLWFIVSDRLELTLAPIRPYVLLVTDYIQRYVPELFSDWYEHSFIQAVRKAELVLVNTPHTMNDCIQYAGVPKKKVKLVPLVSEYLEMDISSDSITADDYFIWTTNRSVHKNHILTLEALIKYYENNGYLKCYVTGVDTDLFDIKKELNDDDENYYLNKVRAFLKKNVILKNNVTFLGELPKKQYMQLLRNARFLLHSVIIDNGTFCAIEAAQVKTPTLSSDYPAMRYISERYSLNCQFFDPYNINDLYNKLMMMDEKNSKLVKDLPDKELLKSLSWKNQTGEFWNIIKEFV